MASRSSRSGANAASQLQTAPAPATLSTRNKASTTRGQAALSSPEHPPAALPGSRRERSQTNLLRAPRGLQAGEVLAAKDHEDALPDHLTCREAGRMRAPKMQS